MLARFFVIICALLKTFYKEHNMTDDAQFWGDIRSWTHGDQHLYDTLEPLITRASEPLQLEAARYIGENLDAPCESVESLLTHFKRQYLKRFEHAVAQLEAHPNVTDMFFSPNPPVKQKVIDRVKSDWGITLPEPMEAFYRQMDGFELTWETDLDDDYASYQSAFSKTLDRVFGGWDGMKHKGKWDHDVFEGTLWQDWAWEEYEDGEEAFGWIEGAKHLESIEGVSMELALYVNDGKTRIAIIDELECLPTKLDFEAYLECQIKLLGYSYWFFFFIDDPESYHHQNFNTDVIFDLLPDARALIEPRLAFYND